MITVACKRDLTASIQESVNDFNESSITHSAKINQTTDTHKLTISVCKIATGSSISRGRERKELAQKLENKFTVDGIQVSY